MKFVLTIDTEVVPTCGALATLLERLSRRFNKEPGDALIADCCRYTDSDLVRSGELYHTDGDVDVLDGYWSLVEES
jgi:hypothetical protein